MKLQPRKYQKEIFQSIIKNGSTLVVLPTGLGKTIIALMALEHFLNKGKVLFLAPTKPLVKQHGESIRKMLGLEPILITGEIPKTKRKKLYSLHNVFVATPQTISNDLTLGIFPIFEFSLIIFDEAHRAVGDYAYVKISEASKAVHLGLTASPGGKRERITSVLSNLKISNVEIRTEKDDDVREYVKRKKINWIQVGLSPSIKLIKKHLRELISKYASSLSAMGFPPPMKSKSQFMSLRNKIFSSSGRIRFSAIMTYSILLNLLHMEELVETQGLFALKEYIDKLEKKKTKTATSLLRKPGIIEIKKLLSKIEEEEHPKFFTLMNLIRSLNNKKIIIFAQFKSQIRKITDFINEKLGLEARLFVGRTGLSRKEQEEIIQDFRDGKFNILVASSVGEEGLDIPAVDAVIFYEPIPSEIRSIQRRGRAGRFKEGEIYILVTKGTRDEYYYWASFNREKKMKAIIHGIQRKNVKDKKEKKPNQKEAQKNNLKGQTRIVDFS